MCMLQVFFPICCLYVNIFCSVFLYKNLKCMFSNLPVFFIMTFRFGIFPKKALSMQYHVKQVTHVCFQYIYLKILKYLIFLSLFQYKWSCVIFEMPASNFNMSSPQDSLCQLYHTLNPTISHPPDSFLITICLLKKLGFRVFPNLYLYSIIMLSSIIPTNWWLELEGWLDSWFDFDFFSVTTSWVVVWSFVSRKDLDLNSGIFPRVLHRNAMGYLNFWVKHDNFIIYWQGTNYGHKIISI